MKIKKTVISLILLSALVAACFNVSAYSGTLTINDRTSDVYKTDDVDIVENISHPDADIKKVTCTQTGQEVEISMQLEEGGTFGDDLLTYYIIYLITTGASPDLYYQILYTSEVMNEGTTGNPIAILYGLDDVITEDSFSGKDTDTITFSFKLKDSSERIISLSALSIKQVLTTNEQYADIAPDNLETDDVGPTGSLTVDAGGPYSVKSSNSLSLTGSIEDGVASDYTWLWKIDDSNIELDGQNSEHTFKLSGEYTGVLYVFDGEGNWGSDYFEVNVTSKSGGSSSGGGETNDEPGFELVIVVAAIALIAIVLKRKRK